MEAIVLVLIVIVLAALSWGVSWGLKDWIDRHGKK
jgi:hypothetical protein